MSDLFEGFKAGDKVRVTFEGTLVGQPPGLRVEFANGDEWSAFELEEEFAASVELVPEPTFADKLRAASTGTIVVHKFLKTSVYVKFGDGRMYQGGRGYDLDEFEDNYEIVHTPEEA